MSLFACQPIIVISFTLIIVSLDSANIQSMKQPENPKKSSVDCDDNEGSNPEPVEPKTDAGVDHKALEQARRTISHLSPQTRRFLFSPVVQNTITNLNQNTNKNTNQFTREGHHGGSSEGTNTKSSQLLGYVNAESGAVEYDLRGKVNKVCFVLG